MQNCCNWVVLINATKLFNIAVNNIGAKKFARFTQDQVYLGMAYLCLWVLF